MRRPTERKKPSPPRRPSTPSRLPREVLEEIRQAAGPPKAARAVAHADSAVDLLDEGDHAGAVAEARRAKGLAGRSAAIREILALAHYAGGEWRDALREMQAYRRMSGRLDQNHVIADCYRALGKPDRAVPEAEAALAGDVPDEVKAEAAVVGAAALGDLGRHDEALVFLRRFPARGGVGRPYDLRVWYVGGDLLERLGRREEAAAEFRKVLRFDPEAYDAAERLTALGIAD